MELSQAVALFQSNQRDTTRQSYEYVLRSLCNWLGPARNVREIQPKHLLEYRQSLTTRSYAPATFNKHIKTIKTLFNWLVDIEEIERTPARVLKVKKIAMYVERHKAMTDEELALLLDFALNHPRKAMLYRFRDYALILFLADTGCRISGAAGLQWKDLDIEHNKGRVTEKGDKTRPVRFGDLCAIAIRRYQMIRPLNAGVWVFSTGKTAIKPDNISLMLRRLCQQLGIRTLSGHSLRHRKGHQFADKGTAPTTAAMALGHSDPMITLQHYYPTDWDRAEKALADLAVTADLRPPEGKDIINLPDILRRKA